MFESITVVSNCVLFTVIRAIYNSQMGTCKAGGVEMFDLRSTFTPRRLGPSPTLETYDFIPYDERALASSQLDAPVLEYAEICRGFVLDHLHKLSSSDAGNGLCNLQLIRRLVDDSSWSTPVSEKLTEHLDSPDSVALKTLEKVFAVAVDDAFAHNVDSLMSTSWADIMSSDRLFGFARSDRCFRTCLDIVLENSPPDSVKVVECDAGTSQAYRHVIRQLTSHPRVSVQYTAADHNPVQPVDVELVQKLGITTVEWSLDSTKPIPDHAASAADVVVLGNVLHRHDNIYTALSAASSLVRDDGFLLIVEPTSNFAIPWSFFALTHDVTNMSDLSSRTCGPFCDEQTWTRMITNAGLTLVAQKSDGVLHTVFLCRKLSSTSPTQAHKIIDVDDTSVDWLEEVKAVMSDERTESDANGSVWLKASKADSGVVGMMNCLRREPNGSRLR